MFSQNEKNNDYIVASDSLYGSYYSHSKYEMERKQTTIINRKRDKGLHFSLIVLRDQQ
jgi:hypothetical protein